MLQNVRGGIDNISQIDGFLKGKRIGFIGGPASVDRRVVSAIDILAEKYRLSALFSPEHGIRGDIQAGGNVEAYTDAKLGIPVYSVYGGDNRPAPETLKDIDVMIVDLQEASVRFYTFLYTLSYAMAACAGAKIPVVVTDRATPLGGDAVAGTICEPAFASFVGDYELPTRIGLTIGEYARYVNDHLNLGCELTIVPVTGWKRSAYFDETDLPWVLPSPNIPTVDTNFIYTGTCVFEGVNVSEGRGTTKPFELIGAPWLDTDALADNMAARGTPGALLRKTWFTPAFSKYAGELCAAVQIHVTDRAMCEPFRLGLVLLEEIRRLHPDKLSYISHGEGDSATYHIDRLLGTDAFRKGRLDAEALIDAHAPAIEAFRVKKTKYHMYD